MYWLGPLCNVSRLVVGSSSVNVLVDTGADVNVMSRLLARKIGIKWTKSNVQLRPYGSKPLKVCGVYSGPIVHGDTEAEVDIFIVKQPLETLISGRTAEDLGIISFHADFDEHINVIEEVEEISDENTLPVSDNSFYYLIHTKIPQTI